MTETNNPAVAEFREFFASYGFPFAVVPHPEKEGTIIMEGRRGLLSAAVFVWAQLADDRKYQRSFVVRAHSLAGPLTAPVLKALGAPETKKPRKDPSVAAVLCNGLNNAMDKLAAVLLCEAGQ